MHVHFCCHVVSQAREAAVREKHEREEGEKRMAEEQLQELRSKLVVVSSKYIFGLVLKEGPWANTSYRCRGPGLGSVVEITAVEAVCCRQSRLLGSAATRQLCMCSSSVPSPHTVCTRNIVT